MDFYLLGIVASIIAIFLGLIKIKQNSNASSNQSSYYGRSSNNSSYSNEGRGSPDSGVVTDFGAIDYYMDSSDSYDSSDDD